MGLLSTYRQLMMNPEVKNYTYMSLCMALNHACVGACLAYAVAELGRKKGNTSSSCLYIAYTLSALLGATGFVRRHGTKKSLVYSTVGYAVYVSGFVCTSWFPNDTLDWFVVVGFGVIGGTAAGILFTAQGSYFTVSARLHAANSNTSLEDATSMLSGIFAFVYLSAEIMFKLLATALMKWGGSAVTCRDYKDVSVCVDEHQADCLWEDTVCTNDLRQDAGWKIVSLAYLAIAGSASYAMTKIDDVDVALRELERSERDKEAQEQGHDDERERDDFELDERSGGGGSRRRGGGRGEAGAEATHVEHGPPMGEVAKICVTNPIMPLVAGVNLAFGFASAYLTSYLNGTVVPRFHGKGMVGSFAAITPMISACAALPMAWCAKRLGKMPVMLLASFVFVFELAIPLSLTEAEMGLAFWLVIIYMCEGLARCIFEGVNKGVFADFFPMQKEQAFAANVVQSGGTAAFSFFALGIMNVDPTVVAWCGLICGIYSGPAFVMASRLHDAETGHTQLSD